MFLPGSSFGVKISAVVGGVERQDLGACLGNAVSQLHQIEAGKTLSDVRFCIPTPTYYGSPAHRSISKKAAMLWLGAGQKMCGWDFDIERLEKNTAPEDMWIKVPLETPITEVLFQICWLRYPYEMPDNFKKFAAALEKAPTVCQSPFHPVFWLIYLWAGNDVNTNHDIMPFNGCYLDENLSHAWFGPSNSKEYNEAHSIYPSLLSHGYRNILCPIAMAAFAKDRAKYIDNPELTLEKAIRNNQGFSTKLWKSMVNAIPEGMRTTHPLIKIRDLLKPKVKKLAYNSFKGIEDILSCPDVAKKAGFIVEDGYKESVQLYMSSARHPPVKPEKLSFKLLHLIN